MRCLIHPQCEKDMVLNVVTIRSRYKNAVLRTEVGRLEPSLERNSATRPKRGPLSSTYISIDPVSSGVPNKDSKSM